MHKRWADAYTWHCPNGQAQQFLLAVLPYLKSKHRQVKILLKLIAVQKAYRHRALGQGNGSAPLSGRELRQRVGLWNQVRLLNAKGQFSRKSLGRDVLRRAGVVFRLQPEE